jgi:deazaflavin-dependent oxidoreductase (nitroreductase family)
MSVLLVANGQWSRDGCRPICMKTASHVRSSGHDVVVATDGESHYKRPGWFTRTVFNPLIAFLTRRGLSVWGSRELRVRGRKSGEWRSTPVNLLTLDDQRYLVAPRGHTQWVKNLRVSGNGELRVGRKVEPFEASEVADDDKTEILRAYLKRWKMEVGVFFDGVDGNSSDEDLRRIAPDHPVFVVRVPEAHPSTDPAGEPG